MGTETVTIQMKKRSLQEIRLYFDKQARNHEAERGYDSYNGSWAHCNLDLRPVEVPANLKTESECLRHANINTYKRDAQVYRVGKPEEIIFESQKKGAKLVEELFKLSNELKDFEGSIFLRTLQAKSETKSCKACGCSFTKKAIQGYSELPESLENSRGTIKPRLKLQSPEEAMYEVAKLEYEPKLGYKSSSWKPGESLSCLVCKSDSFLVTETDLKKANSLAAKLDSKLKQFKEEKAKYYKMAKIEEASSKNYYILAVSAPT